VPGQATWTPQPYALLPARAAGFFLAGGGGNGEGDGDDLGAPEPDGLVVRQYIQGRERASDSRMSAHGMETVPSGVFTSLEERKDAKVQRLCQLGLGESTAYMA